MSELLKPDEGGTDEGLPLINNKTFESAFEVVSPASSYTTVAILKSLLSLFSKQFVSVDIQEMQPFLKYIQHIIKILSKSSKYQNPHSIDVLTICLDIDVKLVDSNLDHVFSNIFKNHENLDENFYKSYQKFLENALKTFEKYQRIIKFIASQQSVDLLNVILQNLENNCNEICQNKNDRSLHIFEVTCMLLTTFLREVKIYAPSISYKSLQFLINELKHMDTILCDFGNFVVQETKFVSKHEKVLQLYLELSFHYNEVQALIYCYRSTYSQNIMSGTCDDCLNMELLDSVITKYFTKKFENCQAMIIQLQRIRISKLLNTNLSHIESVQKMITSHLEIKVSQFNMFKHVTSDDFLLLISILPTHNLKCLIKKFLRHILDNQTQQETYDWLFESRLTENLFFTTGLLAELVKEVDTILRNLMSDKDTKSIRITYGDYFDENYNVVTEKVKNLSSAINFIFENREKIRIAICERTDDQNRLTKLTQVFSCLPLEYMEMDLRKLGLGLGIELAVMNSFQESLAESSLERLQTFLGCDIEAESCFNIDLCFKWLNDLTYSGEKINNLKMKLIEKLVKNCSGTETGLEKLSVMAEEWRLSKGSTTERVLETVVSIYEELGKSSVGKNKRKLENEPVEKCRAKLAKVLGEDVTQLGEPSLTEDNYRLLYKVLLIQLQKAKKEDVIKLISVKLEPYFEFAIGKLHHGYDDACSRFLLVILQMVPQIREFVPTDIVNRIWSVMKNFEKGNWKIFALSTTIEEYENILADLLNITKMYFDNGPTPPQSSNYFDIWKTFMELTSNERRNKCQIELHKLFQYIHGCQVLPIEISIKKKTCLMEFFCYCLSSNKLIVTSQMLDTITDLMLNCPDDPALTSDEFHGLFTRQMEAAKLIILRHFMWNKSRIHMSFSFFQKMLSDLTRRSDVTLVLSNEDIYFLSDCGLSMEKWINHFNKMKKDFTRVCPYFISTILSCITTVTVAPAIKVV
ncbi:hypothetical protein RUM43_009607 [Polyplax serrata]|uniref:Uncharacterized protein n=1 Tax=Polyplax serrata TaxID=468196 RepID=A0AAN8P8R0_POLSC